MGKGNRSRRGPGGSGRRRDGRSARAPRAAFDRHPDVLADASVTELVGRGLSALAAHRLDVLDDVAVVLGLRCDDPEQRREVVGALVGMLGAVTTTAWQHGWQPADVDRMVARSHGRPEQLLLGDVVAHELAQYPAATIDRRWRGQLRELDARVWWSPSTTFLEARRAQGEDWIGLVTSTLCVLGVLTSLPRLERLTPLPGEAVVVESPPARSGAGAVGGRVGAAGSTGGGAAVDERILSRVRQLLAKAESTNFEAEAETFTAGAQALMARHSIDEALLASGDGGTSGRSAPHGRRIGTDAPYEAAKAMLLDAVARANSCRMVWSRELGFGTVVGFEADLESVELLFTSLLVQATRAVNAAGGRTDSYGNSRTRSFRQSFLMSFAQRIGERLEQVTAEEVGQAAVQVRTTGRELVPLLAERAERVDRRVDQLFPSTRAKSWGTARDAEGWLAGRRAADRADVGADGPAGEALDGPRAG